MPISDFGADQRLGRLQGTAGGSMVAILNTRNTTIALKYSVCNIKITYIAGSSRVVIRTAGGISRGSGWAGSGRVRSGLEVFKLSRIGSARTTLTRPDPA